MTRSPFTQSQLAALALSAVVAGVPAGLMPAPPPARPSRPLMPTSADLDRLSAAAAKRARREARRAVLAGGGR